jgi:fructose-specific component phosphotransferase system IIB-like protein
MSEIYKSEKENLNEASLKERINEYFNELINLPEIAEALNLLDKLPADLAYHNKEHTLDVIKETILFCIVDNQSTEAMVHQVIAAAWHDVGFTVRRSENELEAVELFKQSQTYKKLSAEHKKEIIDSIFDTQITIVDGIPNQEKIRSKSGYMLDADVSNFGREDFMAKRLDVAIEQNIDLSNDYAISKFNKFTLKFLQKHKWKTPAAEKLREEQKQKNIEKLKILLK